MKPTFADLAFYQSKTTPAWARGVRSPVLVNVDSVVNARAGLREADFTAGNLMNLLRLRVRNGRRTNPAYGLRDALREYQASPHNCPNKPRRTAFCKKWLQRLKK